MFELLAAAIGIGVSVWGANEKQNADAKALKKAAEANAISSAQTNSLLRDAIVSAAVAGGIYAVWSIAMRS